MSWEMLILVIAGAILYKLKSIHIDFGGRDDELQQPKQITYTRPRKQLKK